MRFERRLVRLEAALGPSTEDCELTREEKHVYTYEVLLAAAQTNLCPDTQRRVSKVLKRVESGLHVQMALQSTHGYREHVGGWVQEMWLESGHALPFFSPLFGSEYDDWLIPNLAARRAAVRRRASILAVVGAALNSGD